MKSVHIYLCCFLFLCTLTFISCIENLLFTLFLFHRRKRIVCFLLPLRKKITTKWCTFTKCYGGSSILYGDSSKPNWNPTSIVNWFVTQFMIGGKCGIEFGVGLSEATRHWIKGVVAYQAVSDYLAHKLIYFTKSSAFNNANIFVVIPICVSRSFGLKGTFTSVVCYRLLWP